MAPAGVLGAAAGAYEGYRICEPIETWINRSATLAAYAQVAASSCPASNKAAGAAILYANYKVDLFPIASEIVEISLSKAQSRAIDCGSTSKAFASELSYPTGPKE